MEKIRGVKIEEYIYDSENERERHVEEMEFKGWECSGQIKEFLSYAPMAESSWYAKFTKYDTV